MSSTASRVPAGGRIIPLPAGPRACKPPPR
jgi:hypothetical protein